MIRMDNIHSLSDFQRNVKSHMQRLRRSGQPHVLTVNGKAELIVQDARAYERMMALIDQAEAMEGIGRGLEQAARGEGRPAKEALADIRKRVKRQGARG